MRRDLFAQVFLARRNFMRNAQIFFAQVFFAEEMSCVVRRNFVRECCCNKIHARCAEIFRASVICEDKIHAQCAVISSRRCFCENKFHAQCAVIYSRKCLTG
jgi:hypothetical protein